MQNKTIPGARLLTAVPYLSEGGRVIDVGTDHAYLPIYLVREGIVSSALACDINFGPIESARANILAAGLADKISTMQTDGLHGTETYNPDHIMIFGMGGELIARILEEAPWTQQAHIDLVLQPMSRANTLRKWLTEHGFAILGETISYEDKYYQTIYARAGKIDVPYTEEELILGRENLKHPSELFEGFLKHEIGVYEAILRGKLRSAHADTTDEIRILNFLKKRLETIE